MWGAFDYGSNVQTDTTATVYRRQHEDPALAGTAAKGVQVTHE